MLALFLIIIIGVFAIVLIHSVKPKREECVDNKFSKCKTTIIIDVDENFLHKALLCREKERAIDKTILYKREANRTRKKHIWAVLDFINSIESVSTSKNFYDLEESISWFQNAKTMLFEDDYHPTRKEIDIAIRFCTIRHAQRKCTHQLTSSEINDICNWESYYIDKSVITNVAASFKSYWDDVLDNYKRPSAKINRINYLINYLNKIKEKESLQQFPNFKDHITKLISHYSSLQ